MAQKDLHSITKKIIANKFKFIITAATFKGEIIDTAFFNSMEFTLVAGIINIASTYTMVLQDSDTDQDIDFVDVADEFILGDPALAFIINPGDALVSLGYIGEKRFVRANVNSVGPNGVDGAEALGILLVMDHARHIPFAPVPTP